MSAAGGRAARYCTVCGAPAAPGSTFCGRCGRVIEVPRGPAGVVYCRECGGETALSDAYCPHCGAAQPVSALAGGRPRESPEPASPRTPSWRPEPEPPAPKYATPGVGVSVVWFLFVGLWLSLLVTELAWLANVTVVGQPLGRWLARRVPEVLTLRPESTFPRLGPPADRGVDLPRDRPLQYPFTTRAIYFAAVGWWASLVWLTLAWVLAILVVPIPVAEWMYDHLPQITTLERE